MRQAGSLHVYSKEFRQSNYIHVVLACLAASLTYFLTIRSFSSIDIRSLGSFTIIYAAIEFIFDRLLWRLLVCLPWINLVNLSGRWKGNIVLGGNKNVFQSEIVIRQTWSRISIEFTSGGKGGKSYSASLMDSRVKDERLELIYNYYATEKQLDSPDFDHNGTAILKVTGKGKGLKGKYFTQRSQLSWGEMDFRKSKKLPVPSWVWLVSVAVIVGFIGLAITSLS